MRSLNYRRNIILLKRIAFFLPVVFFFTTIRAQTTIWSENFTYSNSTTSSSKWTRNVSACNLGDGGYFSVQSNQMAGNDLDGEAVLTTSSVNISGYYNISLSIGLSESGTLESDDYIRVYYKLNGGNETLLTNGNRTDDFTSGTATATGLSGSTIQIVVRVDNDATNEYHYFDNITITGYACPAISGSTFTTSPGTFGGSDGSVNLTPSGGSNPYSFNWSTGATSEDLSNVSAGSYTVTITDNNGCTATANATVTNPALTPADFENCLTLTINESKVYGSTNLTNFPVFINITENNLRTTANGGDVTNSNGYDIVFSDSSGTTFLDHELESYTGTTGNVIAWVRVPTLYAAKNTVIKVHFGNSGVTSDRSVETTWNSNYTSVWHMEQSSSPDATSNNNNGTAQGSMSATSSGKIGRAISLDGYNDYMSTTSSFNNPQEFTISAWFKTSSASGKKIIGFESSRTGTGSGSYDRHIFVGTDGKLYFGCYDGSQDVSVSTATYNDNQWHYVVGVRNNSNDRLYLYVDGVSIDNDANNYAENYTGYWRVGSYKNGWSNTNDGYFPGTIDEARVLSAVLSADWIRTEYENQNAPSAFYTISGCSDVAVSSIVGTDATCNGAANGSANLTATGTNTPLTFLWSNSATSEDLSNIAAGTYTVTVTDNIGATVSASVVIGQDTVVASINKSDVNCNGGSDGIADLSPSGGTGSYTFNWSNSATSQDITGISAGAYTVTVTDDNACTAVGNVTITQPVVLSTSAVGTNPSYYGFSDGSINLSVSGGSGGYSYNWSNGSTSQDISGLSAGDYTVTVTDGNGCTATRTRSITNPFEVQPYCERFNHSNGTTTSSTWTRNVSNATFGTGDYFEVQNNRFEANDPDGEVYWMSSVLDISDYEDMSVSVDLTETGILESDDYIRVYYKINGNSETYFSTNGNNTDDFGSRTASVSGLNGNTLQIVIRVRNNSDDEYHTFDNVCVTGTLSFSIATNITQPSCNSSNGSIDISLVGGSAPFTYNWSTGATTQDISNLPAGSYSVTVTDNNGMIISSTINVAENNTLGASITGTDVSCNGEMDGAADLTPLGGMLPYSYEWSNDATTQDISGLSAGSYGVTITDANTCTISDVVTITTPGALNSTVSGTNPTYYGWTDASANLTPSGGTTPYSYNWSNGATSEDISNVNGGFYFVTITDAKNCVKVDSVILQEPSTAQPYCETFNYSNGTQSSSLWSETCYSCDFYGEDEQGRWEVRSNQFEAWDLDGTGTWTSSEIDISGLVNVSVSVDVSEVGSLENDDYIRVYYKLNGGSNTYFTTYGNNTDDFGSRTAMQTGLSGNTLQIIIAVDNDGTDEYHYFDNVCVTGTALMTLSATTVSDTCIGGQGGSIDLAVDILTASLPISFAWSTGANTEDITGLVGGDYTVTVTDDEGLSVSKTFTVGSVNMFCDGAANCIAQYYLIQATNSNTAPDFYYVDNYDATFTLQLINDQATEVYNALGFNHMDGFFYGVKHSNPNAGIVYKIDFNGNLTSLGTPAGLSDQGFKSATFLQDGTYLIHADNGDRFTRLNVTVTPPVIVDQAQFNGVDVIDIAVNPRDGKIYGYDRAADRFFYVDTGLTALTYFGTTHTGTDYNAGSAFFDDFGNLLIYSSNEDGGAQTYIYKVDVGINGSGTGNLTQIATGPEVTWSDGCSCPFGLNMQLSVSPSTAMAGDTVTVQYLLSNMSFWNTRMRFDHTFGNGITILDGSLENPFSANTGAYGGSGTLAMTNLNVPSKTLDTVTLQLVLPRAAMDSIIYLQSTLTNLPVGYSDSLWSDNPATGNGPDATPLVIQNRPPFAVNDTVNLCYNTGAVINILANDSDWDGNLVPASVQIITAPANGSTNINPATGAITYTPSAGFTGSNTIVYRVRDDGNPLPVKYDTATVVITVGALLSQSLQSITHVACKNENTGAIDINVSGGTAPYVYAWSNGATSQDLSNAEAEVYAVTVTDAFGCSVSRTDTITEPVLGMVAEITPTEAPCDGSGGSISLVPSGGSLPYTFGWSTGATAQNLAGLSPGTYTVTISDAFGCSITREGIVSGPGISADLTITDVTCMGIQDGTVAINAVGGTPPYTYLAFAGMMPGPVDSSSALIIDYVPSFVDSLPPLALTIVVTDSVGCYVTVSGDIGSDGPVLSWLETNLDCDGDTNGSIDLTVSGSAPFDYEWSNGASSQDVSDLSAGNYEVTVTDNDGCISISSVDITSGASISSNLFVVDVSVHGGSNGLINQTVSGGALPYTYLWSTGASTKDLSGIPAGNYTVTITEAGGCTLVKSAVINEPGACPCTWLGTANNSWSNSSNWDCGFVPSDTCDVIIPAGTLNSLIIQGDAVCRNLDIMENATLTINGTNNLDIHGNFTNNGAFVMGSSTVNFRGSGEQHIYGNTITRFHILRINNTSSTGVRMHKTVRVAYDLVLNDGYLFTGPDTVKLESDYGMALFTFSKHSFVVGKLYRKINPFGAHNFPVGDQGHPTRFFRTYIITENLQGTQNLTVWFDTLRQHSNEQLTQALLDPPRDVDDFYNYQVPYVKISNGDTVTTDDYGLLQGLTTTLVDGTVALLNSPDTYVNDMFNMSKTVETDGIMYSFLAPEGIWHFEPNQQPTGGFYHMVLGIENFSGLTDNNFGVLKRPSGSTGEYWSAGGGVMKPFGGEGRRIADGIAKRMYLTTFSEGGAGGGGGGGLPIELLDFKAELVGDEVELTWITATEINNDYFTIEKSNGSEFKQLGIVPGAGNSSETRYYSKIDYEPFAGISYYRLKQTDFDGKFTYSDVVSVNYHTSTPDEENELIVYPNPSGGNFSVVVKNAAEEVKLSLFDNRGKLVMFETYVAEENNHTHQVAVSGMPSGVYYLKADMGEKIRCTKKLMLFQE